MLIEHTIRRQPKYNRPYEHTKVNMDGTLYHFQPNESGDHVAEVTDNDHIKRFLSIDTYRIYDERQAAETPAPPDLLDTYAALQALDIENGDLEALRSFAAEHLGVNPDDKHELIDYAQEICGVEIAKQTKPENVMRTLLRVVQEQAREAA